MSDMAHWAAAYSSEPTGLSEMGSASRTSTESISSCDIDDKAYEPNEKDWSLPGSRRAEEQTIVGQAVQELCKTWRRFRRTGHHHSPNIPVRARKRLSPVLRTFWDRPLFVLYVAGLPVLLLLLSVQQQQTQSHAIALEQQLAQEVSAALAGYGRQGAALDDMRALYARKRRRELLAQAKEQRQHPVVHWLRSAISTTFAGGTDVRETAAAGSSTEETPLSLEDQLQQEVAEWWPGWWGNSDVVGPSPFDHVPQHTRPRRILFLTGEPAFCRVQQWPS